MIKEAYVSFNVAKLLKEKGFDEPTWTCYIEHKISHYDYTSSNSELIDGVISAPTLQMAMKWLREKHNICIIIYPDIENGYEAVLYDIENNVKIVLQSFGVYGIHIYEKIYEEAVEAALKYVLEKLI